MNLEEGKDLTEVMTRNLSAGLPQMEVRLLPAEETEEGVEKLVVLQLMDPGHRLEIIPDEDRWFGRFHYLYVDRYPDEFSAGLFEDVLLWGLTKLTEVIIFEWIQAEFHDLISSKEG